MRSGRLSTFLVIGVLLGACTSGEETKPTPTRETAATRPAEAKAEAEARSVIQRVDLGKPHSLNAVTRLVGTEAGGRVAGQMLAGNLSGDRLWAAAYVYATSGDDPAPLRPLTRNADATVRLLAAAGLVRLGDKKGFPPLIAALTLDRVAAGSEPPTPLRVFAAAALRLATGITRFGPGPNASAREARQARAKWRAWLSSNRGDLTYDPQTQRWTAS